MDTLRKRAPRAVRVLGWLSLGSAGLLLVKPALLLRIYGLAGGPRFGRGLALRDAVIGWKLLRLPPSELRPWLIARGISDAVDAGLIAAAALARCGSPVLTAGRVAVALGSTLLSFTLARAPAGD